MKPHKPPTEQKPSSSSASQSNRKGKNIVEHEKPQTRMKMKHHAKRDENEKKSLSINLPGRTESSDNEQKGIKREGSLSPTLRASQTLGSGKNRLLLCVDNEEDGDHLQAEEGESLLFFQDSTMSSISPEASIAEMTIATTEAEKKEEDSNTGIASAEATVPSAPPLTRKAKMTQRFTLLKQSMPQYKLDKIMRKTIVNTMIDLNYWSDKSSGEESDDDDFTATMKSKTGEGIGSPTASVVLMSPAGSSAPAATESPTNAAGKGRKKSVKIYQSQPIKQATETINDDGGSKSPTNRRKVIIVKRSPSPEIQKQQTPQQLNHHTINDLAQPIETKEKVALVKPKQIQIPPAMQAKMAKLDKLSQEERKHIRETVVNKAVQLFIKLEKDQITIKELKYQNLVKEKTEKQLILLKRFAMGIVEKSMKRVKVQTKEK